MEKFLIADDHPLLREALKGALTPMFESVEFVESYDLDSTAKALNTHANIELVLLDLNMPGCDDFYGLHYVCNTFPNVPVVVVSANESASVIYQAMSIGAKAFITKSSATKMIVEAIKSVLNGQTWIPENLSTQVETIDEEQRDLAEKLAQLTTKQYQVLTYLQSGKLNKQIAHDLGVTEATIKAHTSAILKKLCVNNRTQAVLLVERLLGSH